jgi:tRNA (cytidine/uridine-2'-O-)-methyltransferase
MFHIVLYEPEIAPNTGNIMRLCANSGMALHLVEPLGFDLQDSKLRRAGLDYRDFVHVTRHASYAALLDALRPPRVFACTTRAARNYSEVRYRHGDMLLFGPETRGLPGKLLDGMEPSHRLRIPMVADSRSLNLSNAVAVVVYEAWRQFGFDGAG